MKREDKMRIKINIVQGFIFEETADFGPEDFGSDPRPWAGFAGNWIRENYPDGAKAEIIVEINGEIIGSHQYLYRPHHIRADEFGRYMV